MQDNTKLLVFQDELAGWVKAFDQFKQGGNERQKWLSFWSGVYTKRQRISAPASVAAPSPFTCVFGGVQPGLLSTFAGDDGLAPRILYALGPATTGAGLPKGDPPAYEGWRALIGEALDLTPGRVVMRPDAWKEADRWYRHQETVVARNVGGLAEVHSKMQGYMFRFALILNLMDSLCDARRGPVERDQVERAITLVDWFTETAGVAYGLNDESNPKDVEWSRKLEALRTWIAGRPGCTRKTILQSGPRWARNAKVLNDAMDALGVDLG